MKKIRKKIIIRLIAALLAIVLIFLSPYAKYLESSKIDPVNAAELVIAGEAAVYVTEWLVALLATVGLGSVAYENRDAIVSSYKEYLEAQINTEMFIIDSVKDTCIQVYDKTSNTVQKIPWQAFLDSMQNCQHIASNNFPGIYVKYCPELLESFNEYTAEVLDGNVHVDGVSDALITYKTITQSEIAEQWNDKAYDYCIHGEVNFNNDQNTVNKRIYDIAGSNTCPVAGYFIEYRGVSGYLYTYLDVVTVNGSSVYGYSRVPSRIYLPWTVLSIHDGITENWARNIPKGGSFGTANLDQGDSILFNANFPVFANERDMLKYFSSRGTVINAMNYGTSIDDDITNGSDLPSFTQPWQQELWERVANAPDCGIGSYGSGSNINDWANDIPWISLDSLMNYARTLLDTYYKLIDDILNGIYDSNKEPPATYSDAWDDTISDGWDDVVEDSELPDENRDGETSGKDETSEKDDENQSTSWYNEDGTINYPPNDGAVPGTEQNVTLKPGDVVGRYGEVGKDSDFVTQPGADPDTLSLPPTTDPNIYQEYIVVKEIMNTIQSEIAPWGGSPGGGMQYKLPMPIQELILQKYLEIK